MPRSRTRFIGVLLALALLAVAAQASLTTAASPKILDFDTMVGNTQAFTGPANPIRDINGGGLPWTVASAKGRLTTDGEVDIKVTGLVLAAGANAGTNPIASFRAIVSCLAGDGSVVNLTTDAFPATTGPASSGGGNARIRDVVNLPEPCIAPIVFVTSPTGAWFAATGS